MANNSEVSRKRQNLIAVAAATVFTFTALPVSIGHAQSEDEEATQLDKIQVTGSRISRVDVEGPSPVVVISRDEIDAEGYTTVSDILDGLTQNAGGTVDQSFTFGFTPGAATVDLRGFGGGRTLILVDGRRLPVYPIGLNGTDAFVDLSVVPVSIIERVEVLTDGASAIYGSDAVSGVVNIITKSEYAGRTATFFASGTQDGGGSNRRVSFLTGTSTRDMAITLSGEFDDRSALGVPQRDYSASDFTDGGNGSIGGATFFGYDGQQIADPNCGTPQDALGGLGIIREDGVCGFDRTAFRQFIPEQRRGSLSSTLRYMFDGIASVTRLNYYTSTLHGTQEPNFYGGGEGNNGNPQIIPESQHMNADVAAGASNNPTTGTAEETDGFYFRRLVDYGPRENNIDTDAFGFLSAIQGTFGAYEWELGFSYNKYDIISTGPNILSSVLDNEVANNGLDLFQPIPLDVIQRTKFTQYRTSSTRNTVVDGTISGFLPMELSGGPVGVALHAEHEYQKYKDTSDPLSTLGDAFDGSSAGGGDRRYTGVGLEVNLPVFEQLEVSLAGRFDSYDDDSDVGSAFSPRLALAYRPTDQLLLRASAGQSFRAPDLQRLFGAQTRGFQSVIDTPRCIALGGTPFDPNDPNPQCYEQVQSVSTVTGSSVELEEEEGDNFNVGLSWDILDSLNVTLDYYDINLENIVSDISAQDLLDFCGFDGLFCDQITRPSADTNGDGDVLDEQGALIRSGAQNLARQQIKGLDASLTFTHMAGNLGKFTTRLSTSYISSLKVQLAPGEPFEEQIDKNRAIKVPELRYTIDLDWAHGPMGARISVESIGEIAGDFSDPDNPSSDSFIDEFMTTDLQVRYDFGALGLVRLGVNNIFDEDFSLDPTYLGGNRPNQFISSTGGAFSNALGTEGYVQYEITF